MERVAGCVVCLPPGSDRPARPLISPALCADLDASTPSKGDLRGRSSNLCQRCVRTDRRERLQRACGRAAKHSAFAWMHARGAARPVDPTGVGASQLRCAGDAIDANDVTGATTPARHAATMSVRESRTAYGAGRRSASPRARFKRSGAGLGAGPSRPVATNMSSTGTSPERRVQQILGVSADSRRSACLISGPPHTRARPFGREQLPRLRAAIRIVPRARLGLPTSLFNTRRSRSGPHRCIARNRRSRQSHRRHGPVYSSQRSAPSHPVKAHSAAMLRPTPARRRDQQRFNQCVGCTRQFFTKSFLGDGLVVGKKTPGIATSSRHRVDGVGVAAADARCRPHPRWCARRIHAGRARAAAAGTPTSSATRAAAAAARRRPARRAAWTTGGCRRRCVGDGFARARAAPCASWRRPRGRLLRLRAAAGSRCQGVYPLFLRGARRDPRGGVRWAHLLVRSRSVVVRERAAYRKLRNRRRGSVARVSWARHGGK